MTATATTTQLHRLEPNPGEDQPSFAIRFHESMRRAIPDTQARQLAMMKAWGDHDGLLAIAAQQFPVERYQRRGPVCEFKEHVATNRDRSSSHYGRDELAAITRNMNRRIADTDNFGTLTDGHRDQLNPKPAVLGYRGPFYLGQLGRVTPRWAIFSVEHYTPEAAAVVRDRPTRSAELYRTPRIEDRLIDPCAALGQETPRLELGMETYSMPDDEFERYSVPAMPGASSAMVPSDKYAIPARESEQMDGSNEQWSPGLVETITQVFQDVILDTPQWSFLTSMMQGGEGDAADTTSEVVADAGDEPVTDAPTDAPAPEPVSASPEAPVESPLPDAPKEVEQNAVPAAPEAPAAPAPAESAPASAEERCQQLEAENAALKAKLEAAGLSANETYRRDTLTRMRSDGFSVNVDDELEMVADMTDDQFERYAMGLSRTRTRIPMADRVDAAPDTPMELADVTDGTAENMEVYAGQAARYVMTRRQAGAKPSPDDFKNALKLAVAGRLPQ